MTAKLTPLAFQPAPRPQPRVTPEQMLALAEGTRDLGFGRTTSSPSVNPDPVVSPPVPAATPDTALQALSGPPPIATVSKPAAAAEPMKAAATRNAVLKFDIPEELWVCLRHEAVNRRATVKYLILEALAQKGYQVDLAAIPEDGRRQR